MTTQPDPAPTGQKPVRQLVEPLREIAAFVLLGTTGVLLFVAFLTLLVPSGFDSDTFTGRSAGAFGNFINLATIGFPLIAVLLATFVTPALPKAKLIVTVALAEFAVSAFFGVLFGLLVGVVAIADNSVSSAFFALLERLAWSAVLGLVAYGVWTIFQGNYYTPRPKKVAPPPGMYGQPQYPGQQYPGQYPPPQQYGFPPQQQYGAPYGEQTAAYPMQQPPAGSPVVPQAGPYPGAPSGPHSSEVPPHLQPQGPQAPQQPPYQTPQYPVPQSGPPAPQGPPPGQEPQRNPEDR